MAHKASGYIKTTLNNGVGRYVCQLQRLTFKFCKTHGSSRGLREYIEKELVDFARQNPGIVVYLKPRRHRDPVVVAEYLNGERDTMRVADQSSAELVKWIEYLRTRSGMPIVRLRKFAHTDHPSIQGFWTPFTNRPTELNLEEFPSERLSKFVSVFPTATEQLQQLARDSGLTPEDSPAQKDPK
ncbi:39S ribosomal protein L43, mitochondrial [Ixodes scapularis]|uniref:39S ribosomal protein L43, mitochondrial n=1 Tax=Ixodes scapularis TaxID=6945 RepID=UPI001A9FF9C4|nr:39S ribosomal protein L43, mitochondrial [Ixodes scapularis]